MVQTNERPPQVITPDHVFDPGVYQDISAIGAEPERAAQMLGFLTEDLSHGLAQLEEEREERVKLWGAAAVGVCLLATKYTGLLHDDLKHYFFTVGPAGLAVGCSTLALHSNRLISQLETERENKRAVLKVLMRNLVD